MKDQSNIKVITNQKFCYNEPDFKIHTNDNGQLRPLKMNCSAGEDNHTDSTLINEILKFKNFNRINVLDLGCAGGNFILDIAKENGSNICIGIDGSMGVYKHTNWNIESNKNILRHANLVNHFEILENDELVKFDYVICYEVIEHFKEDQLDIFFTNVKNHLKNDGLFFGSIALFPDIRDINGFHQGHPNYDPHTKQFELHKTVYNSKDPWNEILKKYFNVIDYKWSIKMRNHHDSYYFMCEQK